MRFIKAVINLNKNTRYESASVAARSLGIRPDTLISSIRSTTKCRGDYWMYIDNMTGSVEEELNRIFAHRNNTKNNSKNSGSKKVINLTTGQVFASIRDAEKSIGCSNGVISKACNNHRPTRNGEYWTFLTDNLDPVAELEKLQDNVEQNIIHQVGKSGHKVLCIETNQMFNTCRDADKLFGLYDGAANRSARTGIAAKGHHFRFI